MKKSIDRGRLFLVCIILLLHQQLFSQLTIKGPACVTPGIAYQYEIMGNYDSASNVQVCIREGKLLNSENTCESGVSSSIVRVVWNENAVNGNISVSSTKGNSQKDITITPVLSAGSIAEASKTQTVEYDKKPADIRCTSPAGGGCEVNYKYQWQESFDAVNWSNIPGAVKEKLDFSKGIQVTTFYRRKVVEQKTRADEFSDVSVVFVNPSLEGHR